MSLKQNGRLYEISATATLPEPKDPEEFTCKLHIPQANYTTRRETVFYPGKILLFFSFIFFLKR